MFDSRWKRLYGGRRRQEQDETNLVKVLGNKHYLKKNHCEPGPPRVSSDSLKFQFSYCTDEKITSYRLSERSIVIGRTHSVKNTHSLSVNHYITSITSPSDVNLYGELARNSDNFK